MKKVDVIYTFEQDPQLMATFRVDDATFNDKQSFFKTVVRGLKNEHKETLVKLSCCLCEDADIGQTTGSLNPMASYGMTKYPDLWRIFST